MALFLATSSVVLAGAACRYHATASPEEPIVLFDGTSLAGWEQVGPGRFVLQPDGSMVTEGGMGLLYYAERPFRDFVLELDYMAETRTANSGIFVRFPERPGDPWDAVRSGYEIQIDDSQEPIHMTGSIYSFSAPFRLASRPAGEWNHYRIEVTGQRYQVYLNGEKVNDVFGDRGREGYIGLQNHDVNSRVHFRNIRVTPLQVADAPESLGDLFAVREQRAPIRVLMITATHGWRHHEAIAAAHEVMPDIGRTTEFQFEITEDINALNRENLANYDLLFFALSSLRATPHEAAEPGEGDTYTISLNTPQGIRTGQLFIAGRTGQLTGAITLGGSRVSLEEVRHAGSNLTFAFDHPEYGRARANLRLMGVGFEGTLAAAGAEMPLIGNRFMGTGRYLGGYTPVNEAQRQAILDFARGGGGIVVAHAGLDAFYDWDQYRELVGGGLFREHPWVQPVRITVEEPTNPAVEHFGESFWLRDEIYVLDRNPRENSRVLLSLDVGSVDLQAAPEGATVHDYPLSWIRRHEGGRVFVTSLGHFPDVWHTPDYLQHLLQGMRIAAGRVEAEF